MLKVNETNSNINPAIAYGAGFGALGALGGGAQTLDILHSSKKALKTLAEQDTFDSSKTLKKVLSDSVSKIDRYEIPGTKMNLTVEQGTKMTKELADNMINECVELTKKSAPKRILKYTGIAAGLGIAIGLIEHLYQKSVKKEEEKEQRLAADEKMYYDSFKNTKKIFTEIPY